jgi:hypothetical protein
MFSWLHFCLCSQDFGLPSIICGTSRCVAAPNISFSGPQLFIGSVEFGTGLIVGCMFFEEAGMFVPGSTAKLT